MAWNEPGGNGNDKDPWGHRKNEEGPPDLDEVIKKINDKINGLFGGKGSNGSGSQNNGDGGLSWGVMGVLSVIALVIWGLFGFYTVQPAEQGVVTRFGAFKDITHQGLNWHIPYPIEQVTKINVGKVKEKRHQALMLTQDENIVEIGLVAQYQVDNAEHYLFNVRDPDSTLSQALESALREVVGKSKMDDVLTTERARVGSETKKLTQEILDRYETGLMVVSINMQNAQPPEQVQKAFADVIKAREDEERYKNKAEAYANEVLQRADGQAEKLRQEAQGYKAQVIAHAEGETERFLSILTEYAKAPNITRQRLYLETMESVLSKSSKVMVDTNSSNNLMVLPLDRLLGRSAMSPIPMTSSPVTSNVARPTATETKGNETYDPRSRGSR